MSGGSYNYLCHAFDATDAINKTSDMESMADRLVSIGATDAADETHRLILDIRAFEARVLAKLERLRGVWKAVEWTDSCDWGKDSIDKALDDYRKDKP